MRHRILNTFTGPFVIVQNDDDSVATSWLNAATRRQIARSKIDDNLLPALANKLTSYFAGKTVDFNNVPSPEGPDFYRKCWEACRRIPRGQTRSYAELAKMAGSASAARAAGQAMRNNPLPIIVPCHRVVASGGSLHGFGGTADTNSPELAVKSALLDMEQSAATKTRSSRQLQGTSSK